MATTEEVTFRDGKKLKINSKKKDLVFQVLDWVSLDVEKDGFYQEEDSDEEENEFFSTFKNPENYKFGIRMYGVREDGASVSVSVSGFRPYFYIKVPEKWGEKEVGILRSSLIYSVPNCYRTSLVECKLLRRRKFYWFCNFKKFNFVRLSFVNLSSFYKYRKVLMVPVNYGTYGKKRQLKFPLYESKLEPYLRYMHIRDIMPSGWVKIRRGDYEMSTGEGKTDCQIELKCDWDKVSPIKKEGFAPLIVASFDIECTSEDGSFPKPERDGDKIIQIGTTFHRFGETECFYRHIVTLNSCAKIDGVDVEAYKTEKAVLLAWTKMMKRVDPDFITGYNIWGFDFAYMYGRAIKLGCWREFGRLGRLRGADAELIEKKLSSSAKGDNFFKYFAMEGRVISDLMMYVKDTAKLTSYKLDNVASTFIVGKINEAKEIVNDESGEGTGKTFVSTDNVIGLVVGNFVTLGKKTISGIDKYKDGFKYKILSIDEKARTFIVEGVAELSKGDKYDWGLAKDDVSPSDIFRLQRGSSKDRAIVAKYCVQDCVLCNKLVMKLSVVTNNIGMSNVCSVPLSYLFLRGQGIKGFSLMAKFCRARETLIPTLERDDSKNESYEGAIVFTPKPGVYFEPVAVLDYASLYPSSMIAENLSHDSIVWVKDYNDDGDLIRYQDGSGVYYEDRENEYDSLEGYHYNDITFDIFQFIDPTDPNKGKTKCGVRVCRYAEPDSMKKNIIPEAEVELLGARRSTRNKIKFKTISFIDGRDAVVGMVGDGEDGTVVVKDEWKKKIGVFKKIEISGMVDTYNDFEQAILDGEQLAYKVTCNSLYGLIGAKTSHIFFPEIAASTTAVGRDMVCKARDGVCGMYKGVELVYGDSVVGDTPVLVKGWNSCEGYEKDTKRWNYWRIDDLYDDWSASGDAKGAIFGEKHYLDVSSCGLQVMTDEGEKMITKIIRHKCAKRIFRIVTVGGVVDVTEDHSLLNESGESVKPCEVKVGEKLMHTDYEFESPMFGRSVKVSKNDRVMYRGKDKVAFAETAMLAEREGIPGITFEKSTADEIVLWVSAGGEYTDRNKIVGIFDLGLTDDWVYDLETENHHFHVGPGRMVVHNTDSVFLNYVPYIKKHHGDDLTEDEIMKYTLKYAQESSEKINATFKAPQNLEYEKIFFPFCIFSKKRYVGNKYEFDIKKYKQTSMGIVLKRRDNAPIVKKIYGRVIDIILNERDIDGALKYFQSAVRDLLEGNVNLDDLKISKSTRADYANPTQIAHKVLADRMGERDPGNKPQIGDRIDFCYIDPSNIKCYTCGGKVTAKDCKCRSCVRAFCKAHLPESEHKCVKICRFCKIVRKACKDCRKGINEKCICNVKKCSVCLGWYCDACMKHHDVVKDNLGNINPYKHKCKKPLNTKLLQGDLVEHPSYIKEAKLDVNYRYYLEHQIKTPVLQIFALVNDAPEKILADIEVSDDNKKAGNTEIGSFFDISYVKPSEYVDSGSDGGGGLSLMPSAKSLLGSGISKKFSTTTAMAAVKKKHKKRLDAIKEEAAAAGGSDSESGSVKSLDAEELMKEADDGEVKKVKIKIKTGKGKGKGKGKKKVEKVEAKENEPVEKDEKVVKKKPAPIKTSGELGKVKRQPPKDKASMFDFGHKVVSERDGRVYVVSGIKRKVWKLVEAENAGSPGVKNKKEVAKIKLQHKLKVTFGKL